MNWTKNFKYSAISVINILQHHASCEKQPVFIMSK